MSSDDKEEPNASIPNLREARLGVLNSMEDVQFGLPGIVRLLSKRKKNRKGRYFIEQVLVKFADEIEEIDEITVQGESVKHERTFIDHANLILYVLLPKLGDSKQKDSIRHDYNMDYTLGMDDLKTRAALTAYIGLPAEHRQTLIDEEKNMDEPEK